MIKKQNRSNHLFKNKITLGVVLIIVGLLVLISIKTYKSPIQRKLMGFWNIEYENSYIGRDIIYEFSEMIIRIEKGTINVPLINDTVGDIDFQGKMLLELDDDFFTDEIMEKGRTHFDEMQQKTKGTWKVISSNPDSVFFNVPKHPLHGKYAMRFYVDKAGWMGMKNNIYKLELKNDSTLLICNKGGAMFDRDVKGW